MPTRPRTIARVAIVASLLAVPPTFAGEAPPASELPSPLTLGDVLREVRERNPLVAEKRKRAEGAGLRPRAEGLPDDPMVSLDWWQQPVNFATVPLMVTVRQPIPWRPRLRLRREIAEREAAVVGEDATETLRRLLAEARRAYFDIVFAVESTRTNERVASLLEHVVEVTQARFQVGKALQTDVLRVQSELLVVENERLDLDRTRDEAVTRLNGLLDRPADAPIGPPATSPEIVPLPPLAQLVERAVLLRPAIRRARAELQVVEARRGLAQREGLPELAAWAGYMANLRGVDAFTVGVSSTLPFFAGRRRAALSEAAGADVAAAHLALAAARRQAEVEIRTALLQLETAARHTRLHADKLVPLADAAMESTLASYESGRIEFLSVLEAARAVRMHHIDHIQFLVEFERRRADLQQAVGEELDEGGALR